MSIVRVVRVPISHPDFKGEKQVKRYGRWTRAFKPESKIDRVRFTDCKGRTEEIPTFIHQPAELHYDHHGYEEVIPTGEPVTAVRFTPEQEGKYTYQALSGDRIMEEGEFFCEPSSDHGYVGISSRDSRYFAYSDGTPYLAIGLNLCWPTNHRLPAGREHFITGRQVATMGCLDYERWFRRLSENGGNFARIWLGMDYFDTETEIAGELDLKKFARLDRVVELAREYGIKLKFCFEYFRVIDHGEPHRVSQVKKIKHPVDGSIPRDMAEWFQKEKWQSLWWKKVEAYIARYGGDPVIMAWELWNEINACSVDWKIARDWTQRTLRRLKPLVPKQLVVNSLGSFDSEWSIPHYRDFLMEEMEFQQVHRYLDQGAGLKICTEDPLLFSVDAVKKTRRPDKPILLAETGAVNDSHTGPFRFYRSDDRGTIFYDTSFPPFFAGAAGTGHIWHWDEYVDYKNLWAGFKPFSELISDVMIDQENFEPLDLSKDGLWFLMLKGEKHLLGYIRNASDTWYSVLRDGKEPELIGEVEFDLSGIFSGEGKLCAFPLWPEETGRIEWQSGRLHLKALRYGMMFKLKKIG